MELISKFGFLAFSTRLSVDVIYTYYFQSSIFDAWQCRLFSTQSATRPEDSGQQCSTMIATACAVTEWWPTCLSGQRNNLRNGIWTWYTFQYFFYNKLTPTIDCGRGCAIHLRQLSFLFFSECVDL